MSAPRISVCMLAHNSGRYIGVAIESVLAQSFADWEMLISDDASTDNTAEIVTPYLRDPRIRYIRHARNLRQGANWAFAIGNTSAPYLATLHADDAWEPFALATFAGAFSEDPSLDLAWGNWDYYDGDLRCRLRSAPVTEAKKLDGFTGCSWLVTNNHALPSASAFSRAAVLQAGAPDPDYGMLCDRDYFLRLALVARRSRALPVVVTRYRQHAGSVTEDFSSSGKLQSELVRFAQNAEKIVEIHPERVDLSRRLRRDAGKSLFLYGLNAGMLGKFGPARTWVGDGWRLSGLSVVNLATLKDIMRLMRRRVAGFAR